MGTTHARMHQRRPTRPVGIVIVTYNSANTIERCLDSIPGALGPHHADVVVVDNGSADGTAEVVAARPEVRLIRSHNRGYAGGINLGVAALRCSEVYLVLNPDLQLRAGAIVAMLSALGPKDAVVAPQVRDANGELQYSLRREPTLLRAAGLGRTGLPCFSEFHRRASDYTSTRHVDWAMGAALLIRMCAHRELGGWDESYFLHSEETDFLLRARDKGLHTRYAPDAIVVHEGQGSGYDGRIHSMQVVNRVRLYRRRHSAAAAVLYLLATALQELTWWARGQQRSRQALGALFIPSRRAPELGCSASLLPS